MTKSPTPTELYKVLESDLESIQLPEDRLYWSPNVFVTTAQFIKVIPGIKFGAIVFDSELGAEKARKLLIQVGGTAEGPIISVTLEHCKKVALHNALFKVVILDEDFRVVFELPATC